MWIHTFVSFITLSNYIYIFRLASKHCIFTLQLVTASSMEQKLWSVCFLEVWHTTHTGFLSSRQKRLNISLCRLQIISDTGDGVWFLSCKKVWHRFLKAKLMGSWFRADLFLQTGHSLDSLVSQYCSRHTLHTLWLHCRRTGSLKMSKHTGQEKSASENLTSIFSC